MNKKQMNLSSMNNSKQVDNRFTSNSSNNKPSNNVSAKSRDNSGIPKNTVNQHNSQISTPKRQTTESPSVSSVNSSFTSNRAANLTEKNTAVDNGQIHLDFHNSSSNSGLKG